jgi:hypothetical protein
MIRSQNPPASLQIFTGKSFDRVYMRTALKTTAAQAACVSFPEFLKYILKYDPATPHGIFDRTPVDDRRTSHILITINKNHHKYRTGRHM